MQAFLRTVRVMRSGAVICPASWCGWIDAAGLYEDARTGSKIILAGLKVPCTATGFPDPVSIDRLSLLVLRPAHTPDGFLLFASCSGCSRSSVVLLLRHQRPDDARHSVGQCHGDQLARLARQHPGKPWVVRSAAPHGPADDSHGARDQQSSQIALAHLRYPAEPRLAAGRVLAWHQSKPGGEVAAATEALHRRREGLDRHRADRPDPPGSSSGAPPLRPDARWPGSPFPTRRSSHRDQRPDRAKGRLTCAPRSAGPNPDHRGTTPADRYGPDPAAPRHRTPQGGRVAH